MPADSIEVGDDGRADFVGAGGNGGEILQVGTAKGYVRDADELGALVDGGEDVLERDGEAVGRGNGDDLRALAGEAVVDVVVRREVEAVGNELVARAAPVETGGDDGLADGDVLVHHHAAFGRADDGGDEVAAGDGHVPPAFFPGPYATGGPGAGELGERGLGAAGHGAERVADHVGGVGKDGKLVAPDKERVWCWRDRATHEEALRRRAALR